MAKCSSLTPCRFHPDSKHPVYDKIILESRPRDAISATVAKKSIGILSKVPFVQMGVT